jgi:hypothetical protein
MSRDVFQRGWVGRRGLRCRERLIRKFALAVLFRVLLGPAGVSECPCARRADEGIASLETYL